VGQGDVTSLLAVLIENIDITNVIWFQTFYDIVLYKQKTLFKTFPIVTKAVGYTMDIPADEYPAKRAAQTNATTTPQP
jgi:phosphoglycerol transferase MdoB-like AlkP superfamily enzyme